ncbi:MAG: polysaccharide deacetylase family protein [Patescibacteria group bacterium]
MKKRKSKKIIILTVASALIFCGIIFIKNEKVISPSTQNNNDSEIVKISSIEDKTEDNTTSTSTNEANLQNLSMPVLMYHHIRDFSDPNDKIGTNLSVSPEKFAKQLDLIKNEGYTTITFNDLSTGNTPTKPIILTFDDGYENFYQNAYPELKKRGMIGTVFVIVNDIGKNDYLSEKEIKEINSNGIEIGSHTLSHPDLSTSSSSRAQEEISSSKKALESLIGNNVISFCYPSGKFSEETAQIVKETGYKYAVTTKSKLTTFENLFELNRYRVNSDTSISGFLK